MSFVDRILNKLNMEDDTADDDFLDDDFDDEEEDSFGGAHAPAQAISAKPRERFFSRFMDSDDDLDDPDDEDDFEDEDEVKPRKKAPAPKKPDRKKEQKTRDASERRKKPAPKKSSWWEREESRPERRSSRSYSRKKNGSSMEVTVIRPSSFEETQEIANAILNDFTVILNLEGLDVDIAQRVIDFTCGVAYALDGDLQKVSSYIFILTPAGVDISGDYQSIMNGAFDVPSMSGRY